MNIIDCLQLAGLLHVGLLAAGALMPGVVGLRKHLRLLPPFIRQLVWVYYVFIGYCLIAFGTISFVLAEDLASGSPLARGFCAFLCGFWTIRFLVATFVLDLRPYLTNPWRLSGYHATNLVFATLPFIYGWAAVLGGRP